MAAARYSSDVLSESIQKYRREKVAKKDKGKKGKWVGGGSQRNENRCPAIIGEREVRQQDGLFCDKILKPSIELIANHHYKNIAAKKLWEMGWCDVHEELGNLPYCEKQGQITKVFSCPKCRTCKLTGLCVACYKNEKEYHPLVGCEEVTELEQKKMVKTWGQTKLLSEINEQFKKACIAYKQKEKEALRWLEVTRATRFKKRKT